MQVKVISLDNAEVGELDLPDVRAVLNQMRAARAQPLN